MIKLVGGPLYQWDTDRKVLIENDKYQIHEVHFTNSRMNDAPVVETYEDGDALYAYIPVELLQIAGNLMCYEVTKIDGGQRTVGSSIFGIIGRSKPQDYVYTPSEVKSYDALEERIKQIEEGGGSGTVSERDWVEIASGTVGENVKIFEFTDLENYNELLFTGEIGVSSISSGAFVALDGEYCFTSINNLYFVHSSQNKQVAILMKYLTRRRLLFCKGATVLNSPHNQDWSAAAIITLPDSVAGDRANRLEIKLSASDAVIPSGSTYALYGRR